MRAIPRKSQRLARALSGELILAAAVLLALVAGCTGSYDPVASATARAEYTPNPAQQEPVCTAYIRAVEVVEPQHDDWYAVDKLALEKGISAGEVMNSYWECDALRSQQEQDRWLADYKQRASSRSALDSAIATATAVAKSHRKG